MQASRVTALVVRDGARFTCHGDGLCCTDAHSLGPLGPRERALVAAIAPQALVRRGRREWLATRPNGDCIFREASQCALHARLGEGAKPHTCRSFPFSLVRTPLGTRVVTDHRCPCRTMGERAPIVPADVPRGRPARSPARIALDRRHRVSFATYARLHERPLLAYWSTHHTSNTSSAHEEGGGGGESKGVGGSPFPGLDSLSWGDAGELFRAMNVATANGAAMVAFGDALRHLGERRAGQVPVRARPWSPAFDRAERRTPHAGDPDAMLADFLADELWSLDFAIRGDTFAQARAELATRAAVAAAYTHSLIARGLRADRAMAEAIMVVELGGRTELWGRLVGQMSAK